LGSLVAVILIKPQLIRGHLVLAVVLVDRVVNTVACIGPVVALIRVAPAVDAAQELAQEMLYVQQRLAVVMWVLVVVGVQPEQLVQTAAQEPGDKVVAEAVQPQQKKSRK
jgi:hypothetical protein